MSVSEDKVAPPPPSWCGTRGHLHRGITVLLSGGQGEGSQPVCFFSMPSAPNSPYTEGQISGWCLPPQYGYTAVLQTWVGVGKRRLLLASELTLVPISLESVLHQDDPLSSLCWKVSWWQTWGLSGPPMRLLGRLGHVP